MKLLVLLYFTLIYGSISAKIHQVQQYYGLNLENYNHKIETNKLIIDFHIQNVYEEELKSLGKSEIKVVGFSNSYEGDKASLPFKSFLVEGHPHEIELDVSWGEKVKLGSILPTSFPRNKCRCDQVGFSEINNQIYSKGVKNHVSIDYIGDFRGKQISRVIVAPFNFSDKKLTVFPNVKVQVLGVKSLVDVKSLKNLNNKYLIVSPERFIDSIQSLVEFRRNQGFDVRVEALEDIGKNTNQIKNRISDIYHNEFNFTYALLVGHEDLFPTDYMETQFDNSTPTDITYFKLGGADDKIPDVFYGRLNVDDEEDIKNQIYKIKSYEQNENINKYQIGIASNEGNNPSDIEYVKEMTAPMKNNLFYEQYYFFQGEDSSNVSKINEAFTTGVSWVNYIGHGVGDSWPSITIGEYLSSDISDMNNHQYPVVIDVACQNGKFSYEGRLGERFLNTTRNSKVIGAVAYYGGSVDISWHPPAIMAVGINKLTVEQNIERLGHSLFAGQMYLMENHKVIDEVYENLIWYHLQGDPALRVRL